MPSQINTRRQLLTMALMACVASVGMQPAQAQTPAEPKPGQPAVTNSRPSARELARAAALDPVVKVTGSRSEVEIVEKLSKVLELDRKILRVDGFDPEVIDVKALTPYRIRVQAVTQGVTNLVLTDENEESYVINVFIKGDARHLQAVIDNRFPDSSVEAYKVQDSVALTGWVSQPEHITQIVEIAEQFYPRVLNQMRVGGVQQVMLKVKIMEVQRSKLRRMGFDFIAAGNSAFIRSNPAELFALESLTLTPGTGIGYQIAGDSISGASTAFAFLGSTDAFQGFLDALKEEQLLKILSEPTLVATNGRPAMMLSGGEFPVLVPQSLGTVSIEWRDFGVRMEAVPIILGEGMVRLEVMPEVSERDFANSVQISGTTVPALTTRRVNTQVEMRFGQTLMLAGLISSRQTGETAKIPFLGELPWVGAMFRNMRYDDVETELVILVTPELVAPMSAEQVPPGGPGTFTTFPTDRELFFDGYLEVPNYGDGCSGCGGVSGCAPGCQAAYGAPGMGTAFPVRMQEQTIPLTKADAQKSLQAILNSRQAAATNARAGFIKPSSAVNPSGRPAATIPTIPVGSGGTRPVGYVRPSSVIDSQKNAANGSSGGATTSSRRPGLIEP